MRCLGSQQLRPTGPSTHHQCGIRLQRQHSTRPAGVMRPGPTPTSSRRSRSSSSGSPTAAHSNGRGQNNTATFLEQPQGGRFDYMAALHRRRLDPAACPPLFLAPMENLCDRPMRMALATTFGGFDEACTEFIRIPRTSTHRRQMAKGLARGYSSSELGGVPLGAQLMGSNPELLAEAAHRLVTVQGAPRIDLNCGCPANVVTGGGAGSSLLKDPHALEGVVASLVSAVGHLVPVSAKMRSGYEDTALFQDNLLAVQAGGASFVTIHPRTKAQCYSGSADWGLIAAARALLTIPVVGNGDVVSVSSALALLEATNCDGIMVGRGALQDPFLFHRIRAAFAAAHPGTAAAAAAAEGAGAAAGADPHAAGAAVCLPGAAVGVLGYAHASLQGSQPTTPAAAAAAAAGAHSSITAGAAAGPATSMSAGPGEWCPSNFLPPGGQSDQALPSSRPASPGLPWGLPGVLPYEAQLYATAIGTSHHTWGDALVMTEGGEGEVLAAEGGVGSSHVYNRSSSGSTSSSYSSSSSSSGPWGASAPPSTSIRAGSNSNHDMTADSVTNSSSVRVGIAAGDNSSLTCTSNSTHTNTSSRSSDSDRDSSRRKKEAHMDLFALMLSDMIERELAEAAEAEAAKSTSRSRSRRAQKTSAAAGLQSKAQAPSAAADSSSRAHHSSSYGGSGSTAANERSSFDQHSSSDSTDSAAGVSTTSTSTTSGSASTTTTTTTTTTTSSSTSSTSLASEAEAVQSFLRRYISMAADGSPAATCTQVTAGWRLGRLKKVIKYLFSGQGALREACEVLLRAQPGEVTPEQLLEDICDQVAQHWQQGGPSQHVLVNHMTMLGRTKQVWDLQDGGSSSSSSSEEDGGTGSSSSSNNEEVGAATGADVPYSSGGALVSAPAGSTRRPDSRNGMRQLVAAAVLGRISGV